MISVLILTLNEEKNLGRCLRSVGWSDDVLVLDSFSTDRTLEVARVHGARVMQHRFVNFAEQRNFGIAQGGLRHDWVLHLDADEEVPGALAAEMLEAIPPSLGASARQARPLAFRSRNGDAHCAASGRGEGDTHRVPVGAGGVEAYRVASKLMFQGRWLKHAGLYPSYQVRLGRRERLRFVQAGHGQQEGPGLERVGTLREALWHYPFGKGLEEWWERHNRYSTAEAGRGLEEMDWGGLVSREPLRRRRALKGLGARLPCRPTLRFVYMYGLRGGFLDGRAGLMYCRLMRMYEYLIVVKRRTVRPVNQLISKSVRQYIRKSVRSVNR